MHTNHKKRLKRLAPAPIGLILALITIIKPIMILFILPVAIVLFNKKLKKNKPLALFLTGFFIIYTPFMYAKNVSINDQMLTTYNLLKNEIIDTNLGSIKTIEEGKVLDDFEEENKFILQANNEPAKLTITDKEFYKGRKAIKIEIKTPTKNEVIIKKEVGPSDWSHYNYLNLWIKNKGEMEWLGIVLIDEDGDWWHYDNDQILKKQEWTLLKIPLASLKNYEWTRHGNKKMNKIVEYMLKFGHCQKKSDYEVIIDNIYLSKF